MQTAWLFVSEPIVTDGKESAVGAGFVLAAILDEPLVNVCIGVLKLNSALLSAYHALVETDVTIVEALFVSPYYEFIFKVGEVD